jgi:hypothetical protein
MREARKEILTRGRVRQEHPWLPILFASIVSAPSWLSLLEMVLTDYRLTAGLQWIVDGYQRITSVLALVIEPIVAPIIAWINAHLGWHLVLYPHWRPLFLLMVTIMITFRVANREQKRIADVVRLVGVFVFLVVIVFIATLLAGLVAIEGRWWEQVLLAWLPLSPWFFLTAEPIGHVLCGHLLYFTIPVCLSFVPGFERSAGIVTLAAFVVCGGVVDIVSGIRRSGVSILSGFILAGMIVGADAINKALG